MGQVDMHGCDGDKTIVDCIEVGTGPGIKLCTGLANPVDPLSARIAGLDDGLGAMAVTKPCDLYPGQLIQGQVRHVNVQDHVAGEFIAFQMLEKPDHNLGRTLIMLKVGAHQRNGNSRIAQEATFDSGRDRSGIKRVVTEIRPRIDARDDHIGLDLEQPRDREMDAVRRRAVYAHETVIHLGGANRIFQGKGVTGATSITVGNDHAEVGNDLERLDKPGQPGGAIAVVITHEYMQGSIS